MSRRTASRILTRLRRGTLSCPSCCRRRRGPPAPSRWAHARGRFGARLAGALASVMLLSGLCPEGSRAQELWGTPSGEWRSYGGNHASLRYAPLDGIDAENFEDLAVAWVWRGDNFGPSVDHILRATPTYANGRIYTLAGSRRTLVAIDPATGETLWTYREPDTPRWESSPRQNYGKGVAYHELDGRGVLYVASPGFFLHAVDAETGRPLEGFGAPLNGKEGLEAFPETGVVDMLEALGHPYDPYYGIPDSLGAITTSSPPLVVDDVVVVGSSAHMGIRYTRIDNVPGDILAFDARTGEHLWTFHVIPGPGEFGHETWENDAWERSGNANAWAPLSADPELGLVYLPTKAPTNDVYGGFRPGDNLFATSILALDIRTGERAWHFQTVRHDIWDWDNPVPPILLDLTVDGEEIPALVQGTKQGLVFTLNRGTGEPVWPIPDVSVPQSRVPGERTAPTQPVPDRPAPFEIQGLTEADLIDFTPELRERALELVREVKLGPLFNPPVHRGNQEGYRSAAVCPSITGGTNIIGGPVADPETNVLYVASLRSCSGVVLVPGEERDDGEPGTNPGRTVAAWVFGLGGGIGTIDGIPVFKPPYGTITAIDMNTGEHLWRIPNGDTPERIAEHPLLEGVDLPNTGQISHATALVTRSLLMYGEGRSGRPLLHAVDKATGERLGTVELPAPTNTAPMTFLHEGAQYVVVAIGGSEHPGSLVALRVPRRTGTAPGRTKGAVPVDSGCDRHPHESVRPATLHPEPAVRVAEVVDPDP